MSYNLTKKFTRIANASMEDRTMGPTLSSSENNFKYKLCVVRYILYTVYNTLIKINKGVDYMVRDLSA